MENKKIYVDDNGMVRIKKFWSCKCKKNKTHPTTKNLKGKCSVCGQVEEGMVIYSLLSDVIKERGVVEIDDDFFTKDYLILKLANSGFVFKLINAIKIYAEDPTINHHVRFIFKNIFVQLLAYYQILVKFGGVKK